MTTLGLIGLGRIGAFHAETLSNLPEVSGLVITDERPDVVTEIAAKYGATPADSVESLLASGVDGVVVAAATPAHAELTLAAVGKGLPTFCEKPISDDAAVIRECYALADEMSTPLVCGFQRRFDKHYLALLDAVKAQGAVGTVQTVHVVFRDHPCPPIEFLRDALTILRQNTVINDRLTGPQ